MFGYMLQVLDGFLKECLALCDFCGVSRVYANDFLTSTSPHPGTPTPRGFGS